MYVIAVVHLVVKAFLLIISNNCSIHHRFCYVMSQHSFKRFIHQLLSLSDYTTIAPCLLCRKEALKCNCAWYSSLQFETNVLNVILKYPQIGFCIYIRRYHKGFPAFQADDVTKVHVVSYTYMI
jgi:hypothetical protein